MAGKKEYAVTTVITDLTRKQATTIQKKISDEKDKVAPLSRGTSTVGKKTDVSRILEKSQKVTGLIGEGIKSNGKKSK